MNNYSNVPMELREYDQWVIWRLEVVGNRITKVPYAPNGQWKANVNKPDTWGTFAECVATVTQPGSLFNGIGFMLTDDDPYTVIDIDDKAENPATAEERALQVEVYNLFNSYAELSPGGRGCHVVIKGKIPGGHGRDRFKIGIYSSMRYITFTGNVVRQAPIASCQPQLDHLFQRVGAPPPGTGELYEVEGILSDEEILDMARRAANAIKFNALWKGEWKGDYPSQSDADYALLNMLAYYTRDNAQVFRLFRSSGLGQRPKAQRDNYLKNSVAKIRAGMPTENDYARAREIAEGLLAANGHALPTPALQSDVQGGRDAEERDIEGDSKGEAPTFTDLPLPRGAVGSLARFFMGYLMRPVEEVALLAALGWLAGVAGRHYNISDTGLNHYFLFVARTGVGKEGINEAIANLNHVLRPMVPSIEKYFGPSAFASGQGLIRALDSSKCFLSVLGEFGLTLKALNDPRANATQTILRKVLLDLYGKSGWGNMLRGTSYSDVEKNTKNVQAPALSLIGETTPHTLYDELEMSDIADGLLPRFHVVEYKGGRVPPNATRNKVPDAELGQALLNIVHRVGQLEQTMQCITIHIADDARVMLDRFGAECDALINAAANEGEAQLWNRAHLKALKLAGLIAVGAHHIEPMVLLEDAQYAIAFTRRTTNSLLARFLNDEVGTGDGRQIADLKAQIRLYFRLSAKQQRTYKVEEQWIKEGMVPYSYIMVRCCKLASFKNDRYTAAGAIKRAVEVMVDSGFLTMLPASEALARYGLRQKCYMVAAG